jgi:hypothetical protein
MLSVVSRGATAFEWYTYGPDYAKGDSFSQSPALLERVAHAAQFLARAEPWLYGAHWAGKPQVAFVFPRSSEIWARAAGLGVTPLENAKWVYLALAHAHVPVDILSERQLADGALDAYKVVYIVGPNMQRAAAARVAAWVRQGGVLWTDALGMARDEANEPAPVSTELLGLRERAYENWGRTPGYGAVRLAPLDERNVPEAAALRWDLAAPWGGGQAVAGIGREPLSATDAESLARFADGKPAVVRRKVGQGAVVVAGFWAGLTYSAKVRRADFDMQTDFDPALRALIAASALEAKVYRGAIPSSPLVEAVLLDRDGRRSVALMNWSHHAAAADAKRSRGLQPAEQLRIELPGAGPLTAVRSLTHGELPLERDGATVRVTLPRLDEIDLLTLEN